MIERPRGVWVLPMTDVGVVTIGRNEGERLRVGLEALRRLGVPVVYVDSRSTDGSPELARSLGAEVVVLDESRPIGVPRARNEGFERLLGLQPGIRYVQFVDGDCELLEGWLERGRAVLEERPEVGLVTGRRRERYPNRSIYNQLADLEGDMPIGEIAGSHGDFMIRVSAFRQVGGFDEAVLVSEDCDLCLRLRRLGWKLSRIDHEMTLHDLGILRFRQWWLRAVRTGYGYADGAYLHGKSADRYYVRETRSNVIMGFVIPAVALAMVPFSRGLSLLLFLVYPLIYWRTLRYARGRGWDPAASRLFAGACVVAKSPLFIGQMTYWFRLIRRQPRKIIEYKPAGSNAARADLNTGPAGD